MMKKLLSVLLALTMMTSLVSVFAVNVGAEEPSLQVAAAPAVPDAVVDNPDRYSFIAPTTSDIAVVEGVPVAWPTYPFVTLDDIKVNGIFDKQVVTSCDVTDVVTTSFPVSASDAYFYASLVDVGLGDYNSTLSYRSGVIEVNRIESLEYNYKPGGATPTGTSLITERNFVYATSTTCQMEYKASFEEDAAGKVNKVRIDYDFENELEDSNRSTYSTYLIKQYDLNSQIMNLTPVLQKLTGTDVQTYALNSGSLAVQNYGAAWETVYDAEGNAITGAVVYDKVKDAFFTEFDLTAYDLASGVYNVTFIFTYKDDYNHHYAMVVNSAPGCSAVEYYAPVYDVPMALDYVNGATETNITQTDIMMQYHVNQTRQWEGGDVVYGVNTLGTVSFRIKDDTAEKAPYDVTIPDFAFGHFDETTTAVTYDGADCGALFSADLTLPVINRRFLNFKLYKVLGNGLRTLVCTPEEKSYKNLLRESDFYSCAVLNALNVGDYEMEILYDAVGEYEPDYITVPFTITPYAIDENTRDVYVTTVNTKGKEVEPFGFVYETDWSKSFTADTANLADYLAFKQAYASGILPSSAELASGVVTSATELYDRLFAAYKDVVAKYNVALQAYEAFYTKANRLYSLAFNKNANELYLNTDKDVADTLAGLLLPETATLIENTSTRQIVVSDTDGAMANSLLMNAYNTYLTYADAYRTFTQACAEAGITVTAFDEPTLASYAQTIAAYKSVVSLTDADRYCWTIIPEDAAAFTFAQLERPQLPGGFISPAAIERTYIGVGQTPNLLLTYCFESYSIYDFATNSSPYISVAYANASVMYNQAATDAVLGYFDDINTLVTAMPKTGIRTDYNTGECEYLSYRILHDGVDVRRNTALPGTYDITLAFEGNFTGSVDGLTYTVNKNVLTNPMFTAGASETDYTGEALDLKAHLTQVLAGQTYEIVPRSFYLFGQEYYNNLSLTNFVDYGFVKGDMSWSIVRVDGASLTDVDEIKDAGEYIVTYYLNDDRLLLANGTTVTDVRVTINPVKVAINAAVNGAAYGDTLTDILAKTEIKAMNTWHGGTTDNAFSYDFSKAVLEVYEKDGYVPMTATATVLAGELYRLTVPVTLTDAVNFTIDGNDSVLNGDALSITFVAQRRVVDIIWSEGDYEKYVSEDKELPVSSVAASYTDIDGKEVALLVTCEHDLTGAGVYDIDVAFASAEESENYEFSAASHRAFVVKKDGITVSNTSLLYAGEDSFIYYGQHYLDCGFTYVIAYVGEHCGDFIITYSDYDRTAEKENAYEKFTVWTDMSIGAVPGGIIRRIASGDLYNGPLYINADDLDRIPVGTWVDELQLFVNNEDYELTEDTAYVSFYVTATDMTGQPINPASDADLRCTGYPIEPELVAYNPYSGRPLVSGTDYVVTFVSNTDVGTATAYITYIGNYVGSATVEFDLVKRDLGNIADLVSVTDMTYTGSGVEPTPVFHVNGILIKAKDIVVTYTDNVNVGTATVLIQAAADGNFTFEDVELPFAVLPRTLTAYNVIIPGVTYDGTAKTPAVSIADGQCALQAGIDYTVTYTDNVNAGNGKAIITFSGNYAGTIEKEFVISPIYMGGADVTAESAVYDGTEKTPNVTVTYGGETVNASYYNVSYEDNVEAGEGDVIVVFRGNYSGTVVAHFIIAPKDMSQVPVVITATDYNGKPQTPELILKNGYVVLTSGTDYYVTYTDNVNAGTAKATISYCGNYTGTVEAPFTINALDGTMTKISVPAVPYTGKEQTPTPYVVDEVNDYALIPGTDFVVSYTDNVAFGTGVAHITFIGNYVGAMDVNFVIGEKDMNGAAATVSDVTYTGKELTPAIQLYDGNNLLLEGQDFEVEYSDNVNVGKAKAVITFKGCYKGTTSASFAILPADLSDTNVQFDDVVYTGSEITPAVVIPFGDGNVDAGDYKAVYTNNVNAGTASVEITLGGNYKGAIVATFTILQKKVTLGADNVKVARAAYTGKALTPAVTVTVDGLALDPAGYTLAYADNVEKGEASVTITARDNANVIFAPYTASFTIEGVNAENSVVTLRDHENYVYDGTEKKPGVTVALPDGTALQENVDYVVSYADNVNAGTAAVIVSFFGNYSGSKSVAFTIARAAYDEQKLAQMTFADSHVLYDGQPHSLFVQNVPNDIRVIYTGNDAVEIGKHVITAAFVTDGNYVEIPAMTAVLDIRTTVKNNIDSSEVPTQPTGSDVPGTDPVNPPVDDPDEQTEKPEVIVEYEGGFPGDVTLVVQVVVSTEIETKTVEELDLTLDYNELLEKDEIILTIYDVKLIQIDENGVETEINVSDLDEGATILVKMAIPEEIKNGGKLTRVLHVHNANDVSVIEPSETGVPEVGTYVIEGDYLITRIDRLSEFAFITEAKCCVHWIMLALAVLFIAFVLVCFFVLHKKKLDLVTIVGIAVFAVGIVVTAVLGNCAACIVLTIVNALLAALGTAFFALYERVFPDVHSNRNNG